jgi:hypothetical protein
MEFDAFDRIAAGGIANAPETQQFIATLVRATRPRVRAFRRSAESDRTRAAGSGQRSAEEDVVDLGADIMRVLAAAGRPVQILTAGRPLPKPEERKEERRTIALEENEALIEESRKAGAKG